MSPARPTQTTRTTGLVTDDRCLAHPGAPALTGKTAGWLPDVVLENAERIRRTHALLAGAGVLASLRRIEPRVAADEALQLVHSRKHIARLARCERRGGVVRVGEDAFVGPGSNLAARCSVGGLLSCIDAVMAGSVANAFALLRPPGHHASHDEATGFCLFNAVAIAARHAQRFHGLRRIAIIDWDVHHGNGTEDIFLRDGDVLVVSIHQDNLWPPGRGASSVYGDGAGVGANINVPLPPGTGQEGYVAAFRDVVEPAVSDFRPELILVSAGQDAAGTDPLGRMSLGTQSFRELTDRVVELARQTCEGRLVAFQEGGYSLLHMPLCTLAVVEGLLGSPPAVREDPLGYAATPVLDDNQRRAIDSACSALLGTAALSSAKRRYENA